MLTFRVREYASGYPTNSNNHTHKIEAVSESRAQNHAAHDVGWIYFFADLVTPEGL